MRLLSMHSLSMESVKGLCWLQQTHTRVQIQENFRAMAIWPLPCGCLGICNQVPGESGKTCSLLFSLSTLADGPFYMRCFCVENNVTAHPNQILCKQKAPVLGTDCGWTNNSIHGAKKHTRGKGRTDLLGGNFLFLWFDDLMWVMTIYDLYDHGLYPLSVAAHCSSSACWTRYKWERWAQCKPTQSSLFPRKSQFLHSTHFRYGLKSKD